MSVDNKEQLRDKDVFFNYLKYIEKLGVDLQDFCYWNMISENIEELLYIETDDLSEAKRIYNKAYPFYKSMYK